MACLAISPTAHAQEYDREARAADALTESAPKFIEGSTESKLDLRGSPEAQAILDVARLTAEAAIAFDRGEVDLGKKQAQQAVLKLQTLEQELGRRGEASARSKLAVQRGRLLLDYLGDGAGAKAALLDAVAEDEQNEEAKRTLVELFEREEATAARAPEVAR